MNKLEIFNTVLNRLYLQEINTLADIALEQFPYNLLDDFLDEALKSISFIQTFEDEQTRIELDYTNDVNTFDVEDYKIHYKRIQIIYGNNGESYFYPRRIERELFKKRFQNLTSEEDSPQAWSLIAKELNFYPTPDQDYEITAKHYKVIPLLIIDTDEVELLPEWEQESIISYINNLMAIILGKPNSGIFDELHVRKKGRTMLKNQKFKNAKSLMRRNIGF